MSEEKETFEGFGQWWFINGGMIHAHWKYRRYSAIRDLAMELPKMAWEASQKNAAKKYENRIKELEDDLSRARSRATLKAKEW